MPTRSSVPAGHPCWIDLQTSDPAAVRAFYPEVFGWTALESSEEFGGYFMFLRGDQPIAGCMPADAQAPVSDVWSVYLATDDAAKTLERTTAAGGTTIVAPMPVADLGTMAFVAGPDGAAVGLWQPGTFPGLLTLAEPGAPSWFELASRDYAAAVRFYEQAFDVPTSVMSDTDDFRYTNLVDANGEAVAGIMDAAGWLPEGVPSHWGFYVNVEDADATVATIARLGGSVVQPAEDTPYGRIAIVTDPCGAAFRLQQPPAS